MKGIKWRIAIDYRDRLVVSRVEGNIITIRNEELPLNWELVE